MQTTTFQLVRRGKLFMHQTRHLSFILQEYTMSTKKPAAKKPVAKAAAKPVAKKVAPATKPEVKTEIKDTVKPVAAKPEAKSVAAKPASEGMVLYTIRLSPTVVDQLHARGKKAGVTHAEVARTALTQYFAVTSPRRRDDISTSH